MKRIPLLAKPLAKSQLEAASKFWKEGGWETKEFVQLTDRFPSSREAVTIKAIVLNALYGTHIIAISRVADHLESKLSPNHSTGPGWVEEAVAEIKRIEMSIALSRNTPISLSIENSPSSISTQNGWLASTWADEHDPGTRSGILSS